MTTTEPNNEKVMQVLKQWSIQREPPNATATPMEPL
jgi:hypothetical protein